MGCPGTAFLNGLENFHTVSPSGVTSKTMPTAPRVDQRVSVGKTLGSRNEPRIEVLLVGGGVAPKRLGRAKRSAFRADVIAVLVGWRNKLIDRGIFDGLATATVIEDKQVAFATQSLGDPLDVVLTEEALIEAWYRCGRLVGCPSGKGYRPLCPSDRRCGPWLASVVVLWSMIQIS